MKSRFLKWFFVSMCVLFGLLMATVIILTRPGVTTNPDAARAFAIADSRAAIGSNRVSKSLSRTDVYGSDWQGRELQAMLTANASSARFLELSASSPNGERVEITADLGANSIQRKHWDTTGHQTKTETWAGNVTQRIQNAANGGGFGSDVALRPTS